MSDPDKRRSAALTDGPERAPARAMLKGVGFSDEDLARPLIGVATTWIETMPCNLNQRELAVHVKRGVREAGFITLADRSDEVVLGAVGRFQHRGQLLLIGIGGRKPRAKKTDHNKNQHDGAAGKRLYRKARQPARPHGLPLFSSGFEGQRLHTVRR